MKKLVMIVLILLSSALAAAEPESAMPERAAGASMEERCHREVLDLHRFFQDWFNGALEPSDEEFARFAGVMAEGFTIISPSGRTSERGPLLEGLRGAHGRWSDRPGRIWIEDFKLHHLAENAALVTYEEWQESAEGTRGRLSTGLFEPSAEAPNGVVWLHVHETWLEPRE